MLEYSGVLQHLWKIMCLWFSCIIAKQLSSKAELDCIRIGGVLHNWEASLLFGSSKERKGCWISPCVGALKFNFNEATRRKLRLAGIDGVLRKVLALFSRNVGCV